VLVHRIQQIQIQVDLQEVIQFLQVLQLLHQLVAEVAVVIQEPHLIQLEVQEDQALEMELLMLLLLD
tara:strand:+ start:287 stop:487 length:201 start_codon:yes stop_codon:yes gene_type:complete